MIPVYDRGQMSVEGRAALDALRDGSWWPGTRGTGQFLQWLGGYVELADEEHLTAAHANYLEPDRDAYKAFLMRSGGLDEAAADASLAADGVRSPLYYTQDKGQLGALSNGLLIHPAVGTATYWPFAMQAFLHRFVGAYLALFGSFYNPSYYTPGENFHPQEAEAFQPLSQLAPILSDPERVPIDADDEIVFNAMRTALALQGRADWVAPLFSTEGVPMLDTYVGETPVRTTYMVEVSLGDPVDPGWHSRPTQYRGNAGGGLRAFNIFGEGSALNPRGTWGVMGSEIREWLRRFTVRVRCYQGENEWTTLALQANIVNALEAFVMEFGNGWKEDLGAVTLSQGARGLSPRLRAQFLIWLRHMLYKWRFEERFVYGHPWSHEYPVQAFVRDTISVPGGSNEEKTFELQVNLEFQTRRREQ